MTFKTHLLSSTGLPVVALAARVTRQWLTAWLLATTADLARWQNRPPHPHAAQMLEQEPLPALFAIRDLCLSTRREALGLADRPVAVAA